MQVVYTHCAGLDVNKQLLISTSLGALRNGSNRQLVVAIFANKPNSDALDGDGLG